MACRHRKLLRKLSATWHALMMCALFLGMWVGHVEMLRAIDVPPAPQPAFPPPSQVLTLQPTFAAIGETLPPPVYACACGCGVFDVGTSSMFPQGSGGMVWLECDYQDQNRNWHGNSSAPASDNSDKDIRTCFFQVGLEYLFNRSWGMEVEAPLVNRFFKGIDDSGNLASTSWAALGDIRLKGLYSGFFDDLSLGLDLGLKLPTGDYNHQGADADTQIGTGSTDILFGGYYRFHVTGDHLWDAFVQVEFDLPVWARTTYRPGIEVDGATGLYYTGFSLDEVGIVPIGQVILSKRTSDGGSDAAHPVCSGFDRVLLSPGIELNYGPWRLYGDVEFPVYQHTIGDQLTAPALFKVIVSYSF